MIQKYNPVVIQNRVQLVGDGDDGLGFEVRANDPLHELVGLRVHTVICQ